MVLRRRNCTHPDDTACSWCVQRLLFCMLRHRRRRLIEACIFSCLGCTGSWRTLMERQFLICFISAFGSNSVRSEDRLPLARGAVDPGRMTAGIETPSGSSTTTAVRSASAAVGFVTLKNRDCTSRTITARSGKSTASNSSAQGRN